MRKYLWIVALVLLLAACQNGNDSNNDSGGDGSSDTIVQQPDDPRIEETPVPTSTPIPTAMPLPVRENTGHVYPVPTRTTHVVVPGDSLSVISSKYDITVKDLADANRHYNFDLIKVDDVLYIPACEIDN